MRKIAIVGTAPDSVDQAPFFDKEWEIWSLGNNADKFPQLSGARFNRWFELHTFHVLQSANAIDERRLQFFKGIGKSLVVGHQNSALPDAIVYPKDEIISFIGRPYFTSSIAWMIAMAIYEGVAEIGLWGVNMIGDGEYSQQRACCEYLLGIATGKGIKVTICKHSPLLRAERMYAFEHTGLAAELQLRIAEENKNYAKAESALKRATEERSFSKGYLTCLHEIERRWG